MDTQRIFRFLRDIMQNNNRPWFQEHKDEYQAIRDDFEQGISEAITRISSFDHSIAHVTPKNIRSNTKRRRPSSTPWPSRSWPACKNLTTTAKA